LKRKTGIRQISLFIFFVLLTISSLWGKDKDDFSLTLNNDWHIQSTLKVNSSGEEISSQGFNTTDWIPATVPATVLGALVKAKIYNNVYFGKNLKSIPTNQFKFSWWYRKEFVINNQTGNKVVRLEFDGINNRANIWLNGKLVASSDSVFGAFRRFSLDVSSLVKINDKNILAVEVFPPQPGEPTIGFVDWNPKPPDNNMGIWREVRLRISGDVSIENPFVQSKVDLNTLNNASLTITAEVINHSREKFSGLISAQLETIKLTKVIELNPGENKIVTFSPADYPELNIENPKLWWTNDFGKPELYELKISIKSKNIISDETEVRFGIREISDYLNEKGVRGYKLNGKNILIRGGGWVDDLLLNQDFQNLRAQIEYAKNINLNTLRLEGFWGSNEDLYNLCDENGILLMAGWSCQWEWESYIGKPVDNYGGIKSPEDIRLVTQYTQDQIIWLRNHPSIFVWVLGSDLLPRPELENEYLNILSKYDRTRPTLMSAGNKTSTLTGISGVKMNGPYDYVPPSYWYIDSTNGGAFGFNTETSFGPQVPPLESIRKFIPDENLWPIDSVWFYHCGGNEFSDLKRYNEAMDKRLGVPKNIEEYCREAQYLNYEGMRAMFEAFAVNKYKATGIIQWMYNSAWPKLWWQLYDYYLMPNGSFYGAKKANEPLHLIYDYSSNEVVAINNSLNNIDNLFASIKIYNFDLTEKYSQKKSFTLSLDESKIIDAIPKIKELSTIYFLDLKLSDKNGNLISGNFYCLSTKPDVLDYSKNEWFVTPTIEFSDLTYLTKLPEANLKVEHGFKKEIDKQTVNIQLENISQNLAFMIDVKIVDSNSKESILPVFLEDNYFALLPGEKKTLTGYFYDENSEGKTPVLNISGWNFKTMEFK